MDDFYSLGLLLSRASISLAKLLNSRLQKNDIDLPHSQFIVLRCLFFKDGLSQLEIAKLLSKDAAAIKRTVDNLESKGLVVRHPIRNLKNHICITEKAEHMMPEVLKIADEIISEALIDIDLDKKILYRALDKICINLDNQ